MKSVLTLATKKLLLLYIFFILPSFSLGLTTSFVSADDEEITLKTLAVSSGKDNLQGIYARPLSQFIESLIEQDHSFDLKSALPSTANLDLNDLRSNPKTTSELIGKHSSDALIHLQATKGTMGLQIELALFTKKSGQLWAYTEKLVTEKFDLENVKKATATLYSQLINQIPYQGMILSRTGGKVTINRGAQFQLYPDQEINIIQVIGVKRHPQYQFVTHVEKEIIGKIKLTKIDETLSFGYIIFEKEPQSVQPGLKILLREPIYYPSLATSKNEEVVDYLLTRADGQTMLRDNSNEWLPEGRPTFGRTHILFGLGQFTTSTTLSTDGGQQGSTLMALNAQVDADLWITQKWFTRLGLNQGSAQVKNPLSGSTPENINFSLQGIKVAAGYDFTLSQSVYGPRLQAMLGYSQFSAKATESAPTSFTSTSYSGLCFGVTGYIPWDEIESKWGYGAELWYHLLPSVSETPVTSGTSSTTQIIELSGSTLYRWRPNLYWIGKLSMDSLSTSFSGTGTRTQSASAADLSWVRVNGGIEYLF